MRDLQVLSELAWVNVEETRLDDALAGLVRKGRGYEESDKAVLAARRVALMAEIIPAYAKLCAQGRAEVSAVRGITLLVCAGYKPLG